jgi:Domain of unknown function (DUF4157)
MSRLSLHKAPKQKIQQDMASSMERDHTPKPSNLAQDLLALQRTAGNQAVTHLLQRAQHISLPGAPMSEVPSIVHEVLRSPGQPLAAGIRAFMGARFGYDFSQVRIHADAQAAESARAVNAQAYTVGCNVVFGAGRYAPEVRAGKRLIAHELSHVVQQQNAPAVLQGKLSIGSPSDSAELAADAAARAVTLPENSPYRSSALQIHRHLRRSSLPFAIMQRAVKTWGGEFVDDTYELLRKPGLDGVQMRLRFVPNEYVDAERIGMVQTVSSVHQGNPFDPRFFRSIDEDQPGFDPARFDNTFRSRRIPPHQVEPGLLAGTMIDQRPSESNPLFAAVSRKRRTLTLGAASMYVLIGELGCRYSEDGQLKQVDARLNDKPGLPSTFPSGRPTTETSQVFETTALAVKGVQTGTYYGSVLWGWIKDAGGNMRKLRLTRVSEDRPSQKFTHASLVWNQSTTMTGRKSIPLPVVSRQYTHAPGTSLVANPSEPMTSYIALLQKNTKLQVIDQGLGHQFNMQHDKWWKVAVLDKTHKGRVGWVRKAYLSDTMTR